MYSEKVMDLFTTPQNVRFMLNPDGVGTSGEPGCGDHCMIFIKVNDNIISDISFQIFGCCAAIASASMTTILSKGKTLAGALAMMEQDIIVALDGLPKAKRHCSNIGVSALRAAIFDYQSKQPPANK